MSTIEQKRLLLENMTELLELPDSAYEKAKDRYEDIGGWLARDESLCKDNDPHIFPQGSFRLGTAIRPLEEHEAYDLDLACKLREGFTKDRYSQEKLKILVGHEIEKYRIARGIKTPKKEKHRCWCLEYQDDLSFHMDVVPCIPADDSRQKIVLEAMRSAREDESIAESASRLTVSITDDRHPEYRQISEDWNISNPEGYAKWFEARMKQAERLLMESAVRLRAASIDDLPVYKWKTPLQRSIQLLKRHRDQMFKADPDVKPISIIITTLAARAYQGETDIESALNNILSDMGSFVRTGIPRVPNPVDPNEDFADRWSMPKDRHLNLEQNFWNWLEQAKNDFDLLSASGDVNVVTEQAQQKFSVRMNAADLSKRTGLKLAVLSAGMPKIHLISEPPAKPWGNEK